jgi:hypothetical protein
MILGEIIINAFVDSHAFTLFYGSKQICDLGGKKIKTCVLQ